ncbi:DUF2723 domain-containing protein, partial [Candidatus Dependentiae bacterium]|nr:DUF2723 domain-containing protein [Candidatus Dependentiae bacterium]
ALCKKNGLNKNLKIMSAFFALLYISFSRTYWTESISAEVYILHILAITSMLELMLFDNLISNKPVLYSTTAGIIAGISFSNHSSIIFIIPVFIITLMLRTKKLKHILIFILMAVMVWLIFNLDMMMRAKSNPELNLGNPSDIKSLVKTVTMSQYKNLVKYPLFNNAKINFLKNNFNNEFDYIFLIISLAGFVFIQKLSKKIFVILFSVFVVFGISIFGFYRQVSYEAVLETIYVFFLPLYVILTISFGYGLYVIFSYFFSTGIFLKKLTGATLLIVLTLMLIINFTENFNYNNMRDIDICDLYTEDILNETGKNGILLTDDDNIVYSIWYNQMVLKRYRDRLVIHPELLKTKWFLKTDARKLSDISEYIDKFRNNISVIAFTDKLKQSTQGRSLFGLTDKMVIENNMHLTNFEGYNIIDKIKKYKYSAFYNKKVYYILKHYSIAYTVKGILYARNKQFKNAEKCFLNALECDGDNIDAKRNLMLVKKEN